MKSISTLGGKFGNTASTRSTHKHAAVCREPSTARQPEAANVVNALFIELQAIFPAWRHSLPDEDTLNQVKRTWTKGFLENNIVTQVMVQQGLRRARQSGCAHFPSVGQFIEWCVDCHERFGIPAQRNAYLETCSHASDPLSHRWSHPGVYVAGMNTGWFVLRIQPESYTYPIFVQCYGQVLQRVIAGESFEGAIPKALPERPVGSPTSRDRSLEIIQELKCRFGFRNNHDDEST